MKDVRGEEASSLPSLLQASSVLDQSQGTPRERDLARPRSTVAQPLYATVCNAHGI
jgi:hypothetical protein